jgi:hypothetical protein
LLLLIALAHILYTDRITRTITNHVDDATNSFISGAIWVPSSVLLFVAIKCSGLALAHTLWAVMSLLSAFLFDVFLYSDALMQWELATTAAVLVVVTCMTFMVVALHGFATDSHVRRALEQAKQWKRPATDINATSWARATTTTPSASSSTPTSMASSGSAPMSTPSGAIIVYSSQSPSSSPYSSDDSSLISTAPVNPASQSAASSSLASDEDPLALSLSLPLLSHVLEKQHPCTWLSGISLSMIVGIASAIIAGILNGCLVVPLYYAPSVCRAALAVIGGAWHVATSTDRHAQLCTFRMPKVKHTLSRSEPAFSLTLWHSMFCI